MTEANAAGAASATATATPAVDPKAATATATPAVDPKAATATVTPSAAGGSPAAVKEPTLASGATSDKTTVQGKWSDTWREDMAAGDEKQLARLKRFATPTDLKNSYLALEQKLSSGELKAPLAKDATPEQITEWRKANGIPETPDKYDIKLPDGIVMGEGDKPTYDAFTKFAHEKNWTPEQVAQGTEWFLKTAALQKAQQKEQDITARGTNEDALRAEWGGDFKGNIARVTGMLDSLGDESADYIFNSRGPDGRLFGDSPKALKGLLKLAIESGAYDGPMPGTGGGDSGQSIKQEMQSIEKKMGTQNYTQNDRVRYMELVDMNEKFKKRSGQAA